MNKHTVTLTMKDTINNKIVEREIDITNIIDWNTGMIAANQHTQTLLLKNWIEERGNDQHATKLELLAYSIN